MAEDGECNGALESARALERRGQVDGAVEMYLRAEAVDEAARVLGAARRFAEGGRMLFESLGTEAARAGELPAELKRRALNAAIFLGRGGEVPLAVELLISLGERNRAIELLERAGDRVAAARLRSEPEGRKARFSFGAKPSTAVGGVAVSAGAAERLEASGRLDLALEAWVQLKQHGRAAKAAEGLGRLGEAGGLYAEAGMPFEAARCYLGAGDTGKALDNLVRVGKADERYRQACVEAIRISSALSTVGFSFENFLTRFVADGPASERELESFYLLAKLYEQHDLVENAKEALARVLAVSPAYRDAKARLARLDEETRGSEKVYARILEQDSAFTSAGRRRGTLGPDDGALPELPDLPGLPALPPRATRPPAAPEPHRPATPPGAPPQNVSRLVDQAVERIGAELDRVPDGPGAAPAPPTGSTLFSASPNQAPAPAAPPPGDPATAFAEGSVAVGRYRIEQRIGQGGMASVFRAADLELGEEVALKVFTHGVDDGSLQRFRQELKLSRQLSHPNVVRLHDIGVHQGLRFISMELLVGGDLKGLLARGVGLAQGLGYLIQACAGLQAAHDVGIVHRDVKPENLFVTAQDLLKVMDFGIAKQQRAPGLTVAGMIAGTPEYMSPEQINNFAQVTPLTDVYSLGVVAYEMFAGRLPFAHAELMPLLMMHLQQAPEPPRKFRAEIPEPLEAVILRAMAKDPADRFGSCSELGAALGQVRARCLADELF